MKILFFVIISISRFGLREFATKIVSKSTCIIARTFKQGDLIEEHGENLNKSFSEIIAFREKHYIWGIVFHKHKSLVA